MQIKATEEVVDGLVAVNLLLVVPAVFVKRKYMVKVYGKSRRAVAYLLTYILQWSSIKTN